MRFRCIGNTHSLLRQVSLLMAFATLSFTSTTVLNAQVSVLTQHNDNARTGANLNERTLNTSNVNVSRFGKLFARNVDGEVYAQPLYVPGLNIGGRTRNVLFVATMNNTLYAFDADDPGAGSPLWIKNYGNPVPVGDVQFISDISVKVGLLSTPVINAATGTMYFVQRNKDANGGFHQYLHAINILNGAEKFNGPTEITGTYRTKTFDPRRQNQRSALTLANGMVYIAWASHNDIGPYYGWVMAYDATTLRQRYVYNTTSDGSMAGIWQAGQGLTVDVDGNLYLMTGNGTFNANTGGVSLGCTIIKLRPDLTVADWFTPFNVNDLNARDDDLGSAGLLGLPGTNYLVGGGKEGKLYLVNRNNMGRFTAGRDNVAQSFLACNGHIHGSPVYYNGPNGPCIYVWSEQDYLKVFRFNGTTIQTTPFASSAMRVPGGMPGGFLSLSANGTTPGTSLVWASHPLNANANNAVVEGIFRVFDASTATNDSQGTPRLRELWNSKMNPARDDIGKFAKFCPPTIANGKVYLASFGTNDANIGASGQVVVYGLLPNPVPPMPPTDLIATPGNARVTLAWTPAPGADRYNVKRSLQNRGPYSTIASNVTSPSYTNIGLTNGTAYYYVVTGVNAIGEGQNSNQAAAIPQNGNVVIVTMEPTADASVRSGAYANTNYGSDPQLVVKVQPPDLSRQTFLKFNISRFQSNITNVRLHLYGSREGTNSSSQDSVYGVADTTWAERSITWNNKPTLGNRLSTTTIRSQAGYYEWDVTSFVQAQRNLGRSFVSLAIAMDSLPPDGFRDNFNSKEAGNNSPQLVVTSSGAAPVVNYTAGFTGGNGLLLNGSARINGSRLQITDGGRNQVGSAFTLNPVPVSAFRSTFQFQLTNPEGEGFTFTIQSYAPFAIGASGGGLGFGPDPDNGSGNSIGRSIAIKFDLKDNQGEGNNSTGIYLNGDYPTYPASDLNGSGIDLHSGHIFQVDMNYDGTRLTVQITDTATGATAIDIHPVNIPGIIGRSTGYIGFTGSTSRQTAIQEILSWTLRTP